MAEPGAVRELPVQKAVGETRHPEAPAELIFGSLVAAVPAGEQALAPEVEPDPAMEEARDLVRAMAPGPELSQVVEPVRGLDRVVARARGTEREQVVEPSRDSGQLMALGPRADGDWVVEPGRDSERVVELVPSLVMVLVGVVEPGRDSERAVEPGRVWV